MSEVLNIANYLKYANLQMAAEAFILDGEKLAESGPDLEKALVRGNDRASRFTQLQAEQFSAQWVVVDQQDNTPTGFSGTLFRNRETNEYVISFRSTEFIDDSARDNAATNTLETRKSATPSARSATRSLVRRAKSERQVVRG